MWPFRRRRRAAPTGTLRVGEHRSDPDDYRVWTVSESRHPDAFEALWAEATPSEHDGRVLRRWATLVPIRDPRFGVADVAVQFNGQTACYLRPPHLGAAARRAEAERVASLEVPALIERSPAGATVRLILPD